MVTIRDSHRRPMNSGLQWPGSCTYRDLLDWNPLTRFVTAELTTSRNSTGNKSSCVSGDVGAKCTRFAKQIVDV